MAVFDFNTAVDEAYENYPQLKRRATFYDMAQDEARAKGAFSKMRLHFAKKRLKKDYEGRGGGSDVVSTSPHGSKMRTMRFDFTALPEGHQLNVQGGSFVFDHELGHLLDQDFWKFSGNHGECVADAFAVIRHIQRYGTEGEEIPNIASFRAWEATHNDASHISVPVIARIWADRHAVDFAALSPQETFRKALDYAEAFAPSVAEQRLIKQGYSALNVAHENVEQSGNIITVDINPMDLYDHIATTCLTTPNVAVFLTGAGMMLPAIDKKRTAWAEVTNKIHARARELGVENLLGAFRENAEDIELEKATAADKRAERAHVTKLLATIKASQALKR